MVCNKELIKQANQRLNTPRDMYRKTKTYGDCPLCGRRHYFKSKSNRCYWCNQALKVKEEN